MNIDSYLNDLAGETYDNTLGNYDATLNNEQSFDALEVENYFYTAKRKPRGVARQMAERVVRQPGVLNKVKEAMRQDGYRAGFEPSGAAVGQGLSAQFDIQITRIGAVTIAGVDLPIPLFGALDIASKYNGVLTQPSGTTISALSIGAIGTETQVRISYTKGANTDIVAISISQYDYPSFLNALLSSRFTVSNARYSIADTTATGVQQLTKPFRSIERSMFGAFLKNDIPLSSSKSPFQFQNGIVDILGTFNITAQTTWVLDLQPLAGQVVTISAFVSQSTKVAI
jgi:hypothetical protein